WEFLGWIGEKEPGPVLLDKLERTELTPADSECYPAARQAVIDLGIVRRRKVDVAADIPARRIADMPVELEGGLGASIREAERALAERLVRRYERALAARTEGVDIDGIDHALVRQVASWEQPDAQDRSGEGRPRRRLHGAAVPQRGQGRLLRQAHRRHGRGRGHLRAAGHSVFV